MLHLTCLMLGLLAVPGAPDPGDRYGEYRTSLEALGEPARAAIAADGTVFVVETSAHRVSHFAADGTRLGRFGMRGGGAGELDGPQGIALDDEGRVFVADSGNHRIVVFSAAGEHVREWGGFGTAIGRLARPTGVAVHGDDVFVSDSGNHRIQRFDREGRARGAFGRHGRADGELRNPLGLAVDDSGNVFVADAGNHRVVVFDAQGGFARAFGDRGSNPGLFSGPADVAARGGRVYVADRGNHRIQVFDADGAPLYEWGIHALRPREGEGKLHYPSGIAVDAAGALAVVCEGFSDRVQLFGAATGPPELYMTDPAILPQGPARHYGMAIDSGGDLLFVAEPETETVLVFVLVDPVPVLIGRLGGYGAAADDLVEVVDVAASADGRECAITDVGSRRLSTFRLDRAQGEAPRFDPTLGWFVRSADLERVRERRFPAFDGPLEPGALERAEDGRLYVVDELRARILRFSPSFELELAFGGRVRGPGELRGPTDLLLTASDSELYVVDAPSRRVVVFDRSGRFLRALEGGLERPHGVALGPDGTAYVTDAGAHRVVVFGADGEVRATFGREGLGAGEFFKPRGIVVDGRGRVIVLDHGNHRGQIFTPEGEFLAAFGSRLYVKEARATR